MKDLWRGRARRAWLAVALVLVSGGLAGAAPQASVEQFPTRLINIGNALEAPIEGTWGVFIEDWFFDEIRSAGFQGIRLPIRWSAHADLASPYTIDPAFFARVDHVLDQASARDLVTILDLHHYDELMANPAGERDRFLALWSQIAEHYAGRPSGVVFELLNEPQGAIDGPFWNQLVADTLAVIRPSHPDRVVVVGPVLWSIYAALPTLEVPENDPNILVTFHYYFPLQFTHQGAAWVAGSDAWLGTTWGTAAERQAVANDFNTVAAWAAAHDRRILLGEFGAYSQADMASRAEYTTFVRQQAEERGFAWAYWEFGAGFGAYDIAGRAWVEPLYRSLIPAAPPAPPVPAVTGWGIAAMVLALLAAGTALLRRRHARIRNIE